MQHNEELTLSQKAFIEMIQTPPENHLELHSPLPFRVQSPHRLEVYRTGYYARLINASADILERVSNCLGQNFTYGMLEAYFETRPAHSGKILDCLSNLPDFVKKSSLPKVYFFLPDVLTLCIANFRLLRGADTADVFSRSQNLGNLYLIPEHFYLDANYPLYFIWENSAKESKGGMADMTGEKEGVLLLKRGYDSIHSLAVPHALSPLLLALKDGLALENAILETQSLYSDFDLSSFQNWISLMTSCGALKTGS